jgi:nucleoredoxin
MGANLSRPNPRSPRNKSRADYPQNLLSNTRMSSALFGRVLSTKSDRAAPAEEVLKSAKYIGIYFSAHWCPPCRGFTPVLIKFYNEVKALDPNLLEIVFVSSDRDEKSYNEYFGEMPWTALPYEGAADIKEALTHKFNVRGIPFFAVLDQDGNIRDPSARATVIGAKDDIQVALQRWESSAP